MNIKHNIRFAKIEDLPVLVDIYNQAIRCRKSTGDLDEFTIETRMKWFKKFDTNKFPLYVLEVEGQVVAYCSLSPYRSGRRAMAQVAEISYYVDFNHHRQGYASMLMKHAIADCPRVGLENLLAILLDINMSSVALLTKFGFTKWGHLPQIIQIENNTYGQFVYGLSIKNLPAV